MEDSLNVQGIEGGGDAVGETDDFVNRRRAIRRERFALDPLHQRPAGAPVLLFATAVKSRKRRVLHPREDSALALEPFARAEGGVHSVEGVDLRGQAGSGLAMASGEDLTRAAPAHDLAELDLLEAESEARRHWSGPSPRRGRRGGRALEAPEARVEVVAVLNVGFAEILGPLLDGLQGGAEFHRLPACRGGVLLRRVDVGLEELTDSFQLAPLSVLLLGELLLQARHSVEDRLHPVPSRRVQGLDLLL